MDKLCLFTTYNENNWCNLSLLWIGTDNKIVPNTEYRVHHWGLGGLCNPAFLLYRYCRHIKVMSNSIIPKAQRKTTSRHILNYFNTGFHWNNHDQVPGKVEQSIGSGYFHIWFHSLSSVQEVVYITTVPLLLVLVSDLS